MSPMKGVRKPKNARPAGIRIGSFVFPPQAMVALFLSLLYVWFFFGGVYERGNFFMQALYFAIFALVTFYLQSVRKVYRPLSIAFIVLAVPMLFWDAVAYFGYGPAVPDLSWLTYVGIASLLLGAGLTAALMYYEKGKPADIFVQAGDLDKGVYYGVAAFVAAAVVAAACAVVFYSPGSDVSRLAPAVVALLVFAVTCGVVEELLFRGLLLSRLITAAGLTGALVIQAIAFAAYEAAFLYMLKPDFVYAVAVFVAAAVLGIAFAWETARTKSIFAASLSHVGVYLVLALPLFAPLFTRPF